MCGVGTSFTKLNYTNIKTGEERNITIAEFMDYIIDDIMARIAANPLLMVNPAWFEKEIFAVDTYFCRNCRNLRSTIRTIIEGRKASLSEENKAENKEDSFDVVSLLLQDDTYNDIDDMIDDIFVMFIAGSKTIQNTTSNLITTMLYEPEVYAKLRAEIDPLMDLVKDNINEKMTLEKVEVNEYLKNCYMEVLRRDTGISASSTSCMAKDINISGVDLKKDEAIIIGIKMIQNDPRQW